MVKPYKPLYTVKEVAEILLIGENEAYRLINSGKLPHLLLKGKKVRGSDLERFIEQFPVEGGELKCKTTDRNESTAQEPGKEGDEERCWRP